MKNSKHGLSKGTAVSESMKKIVNEQRFLSIAEVNQTILSAFEKKKILWWWWVSLFGFRTL